jgi:hypothetical protein
VGEQLPIGQWILITGDDHPWKGRTGKITGPLQKPHSFAIDLFYLVELDGGNSIVSGHECWVKQKELRKHAMNMVPVMGAPNSIVRFFQEDPMRAVDLLKATMAYSNAFTAYLGDMTDANMAVCQTAWGKLSAAIKACPPLP